MSGSEDLVGQSCQLVEGQVHPLALVIACAAEEGLECPSKKSITLEAKSFCKA